MKQVEEMDKKGRDAVKKLVKERDEFEKKAVEEYV